LGSHARMLLHVVCHSYSCTALCAASLLTGHRAIALPQFRRWYFGCLCATVSASCYIPMTYSAHPWQKGFPISARQCCKGFIMGCFCSQQRTQAQPSHRPAQHHLRALLLSLHCASSRTDSKLTCCSSPGRNQTTPLQHHA